MKGKIIIVTFVFLFFLAIASRSLAQRTDPTMSAQKTLFSNGEVSVLVSVWFTPATTTYAGHLRDEIISRMKKSGFRQERNPDVVYTRLPGAIVYVFPEGVKKLDPSGVYYFRLKRDRRSYSHWKINFLSAEDCGKKVIDRLTGIRQ